MSTRNKGTPAKKAASKKPAKRKAAPKAKKVVVSKKKPVARKKAKPRAVSPIEKHREANTKAFKGYEDKLRFDTLTGPLKPRSWWRRALSWLQGR